MESWLDEELSSCGFKDKRLEKRFKTLVATFQGNHGKSIPQIFEEWSATKAVYRFLSNPRIEESEILEGHFHQTHERINANAGPVLVLHDTTEFSYKRKHPERIGYTGKSHYLKKRTGPPGAYKVCGILLHRSLAVTSEGLPLGLTSARFWRRQVVDDGDWF